MQKKDSYMDIEEDFERITSDEQRESIEQLQRDNQCLKKQLETQAQEIEILKQSQ